DYIVESVRLVARLGWALLPRYRFEISTGTWRHRDGVPRPPMSLADIDFRSAAAAPSPTTAGPESYPKYLAEAERILTAAAAGDRDCEQSDLEPAAEALRWFPVGSEVL